jgi:hypothetical protein
MPDRPQKPELENEQRLMALLALTTQELPTKRSEHNGVGNVDVTGMNATNLSNEQLQALYERLDADPAALESLLRSERERVRAAVNMVRAPHSAPPASRGLIGRIAELFAMPTVRYASAFAATALVAAIVLLQAVGSRPAELIQQSYAQLNIQQSDPRLTDLVLPWERSSPSLGFSAGAANDSPAAFSFAAGLLKGKRKLLALSSNATGGTVSTTVADDDMEKYVLLGEWNIVMWAACEAKPMPPAEFWETQISVGQSFAKVSYANAEEESVIKQHLANVQVLLVALTRGETPARTARALANELLLFRERFAPNDQAARAELARPAIVSP